MQQLLVGLPVGYRRKSFLRTGVGGVGGGGGIFETEHKIWEIV